MGSLAALRGGLNTNKKGTYLGINRYPGNVNRYAGSASGIQGLLRRVRDHESPAFRAKHPLKFFYQQMAKPGAETFFVPLVVLDDENVAHEQFLITETACSALFRTNRVNAVLKHVLWDERRWVPFAGASNLSVPVSEGAHPENSNKTRDFNREKLRNRLFQVVPWSVTKTSNGHQITVSRCHLGINKDVAQAFCLADVDLDNREVWARFELSPDGKPHPKQWAASCPPSSDGSQVGVRVFKDEAHAIRDEGFWLRAPRTVKVANSLSDLMSGKMFQADYELPADRAPMFQKWSDICGNGEPKATKPRRRRKDPAAWRSTYGTTWGDETNGKRPAALEAPGDEGDDAAEPAPKRRKTAPVET